MSAKLDVAIRLNLFNHNEQLKPISADNRHEAKPSELEATSATRTHRRQPIPASLSGRNPRDMPEEGRRKGAAGCVICVSGCATCVDV